MTSETKDYPADAFISEIKTAINSIPVDKLRSNIISIASEMPVDKRLEFFQAIAFEDIDEINESEVDFDDDLQLIDDVESFYKKISMGFYDHSLDIDNPKELPAWVDDMDVLFSIQMMHSSTTTTKKLLDHTPFYFQPYMWQKILQWNINFTQLKIL